MLKREKQKLQKLFNEIITSLEENAYNLENWTCEIKTSQYKHIVRVDVKSKKLSRKQL